jgi:hypothetical protein
METVLTFAVLVLAIALTAVGVTLNEKINQHVKRHDLEMSAVSKEITRLIRLLHTTREELEDAENKIAEYLENSSLPEMVEEEVDEKREPEASFSWLTAQALPDITRDAASTLKADEESQPKASKSQPDENSAVVAQKRKQDAAEERARNAKKARRLKAALEQRDLGEAAYFRFFLKRAYKLRRAEAESLCFKLEAHGRARSEAYLKLDYLEKEVFRRWKGKDEQVDELRVWLDKTISKADNWASRQAGFDGGGSTRIEALEDRQNNRYGD